MFASASAPNCPEMCTLPSANCTEASLETNSGWPPGSMSLPAA